MTKTVDIKAFIDDRPIAPFLWVARGHVLPHRRRGRDGRGDHGLRHSPDPAGVEHLAAGFRASSSARRPSALSSGRWSRGPSSDRFGRKIVLTTSVLLFCIFTVIAAWSSSPQEMALLRLLAGMGMGAAMPNATTLLSEYAPLRRRSLLITIMFSGFTLGSAAIGFIAGYMIPHYGWRSVLLVGGITPLVLVPFLWPSCRNRPGTCPCTASRPSGSQRRSAA